METTLDRMIGFLLSQSMHLAILFAVIGALVWLLNKRSAHVRYLLWLIVLAKCLVPPLLTIPLAVLPEQRESPVISPLPLHVQAETEMPSAAAEPQPRYIVVKGQPDSAPEQAVGKPVFTAARAGIVWICGSVLYLTWILIRAVRFQIQLRRLRIRPEESLEKEIAGLAAQFWPGLKVRAYLLEGIGQPFVWGLWRGAIYLPANFTHTTKDQQRQAILLHEMAHLARADALVNLIQVIAQGFYWFHPLVWIANRIIRAEREKCCDETAIAKLKTTPKEYGGAIVEVLTAEYQSRMAIPSLAVAGPTKNIEDRLKTIMNPKRRFYTRPTFIALATILLLASIIIPTAIALTHKKLKPEKLTPPFEVSGTVVDAQTGEPIDRTVVFDDGYGPEPRQETTTDPNGTFRYKTWNEEHNITARKDGYESQTLVLKTFPFSNANKLHFKLVLHKSDPNVCPVDFEITSHDFRPGDSIEITDIIGDRPRIEVGGTYTVKGSYTLSSQDRAMLRIYATNGQTRSDQGPAVDRGSGDFVRTFTYLETGDLHLSYYPADGGSSFGGLYFAAKEVAPLPQGPVDITPTDFDIHVTADRRICYLVVSIQNNSEYPLPKHRIRYYRGDPNDGLDEASNPHSGWHEAGPVEPGRTWNERTRDFHLPDGEYEFTVVLDYNQAVPEIDETNNIAAMRVRIQNGQLSEKSPFRPESKTQEHREAEKPEAAAGSMRITFKRGVPLTDALEMLSKYYKQTIIPSQAVMDARDKVPVTDLFDITSLEMALEAILGTNRYVKDGNFIRVVTAEEYAALPPGEKAKSDAETIPVKISVRLLLLPDDPEKIESVFDNAGIGFPKIFTSVTEGPADSQAIRTQFEARIRSLDPASASLSAFLDNKQVESLLKATQKEPDAAVLSAPTVLVWSGENAEIAVGENLPAGTGSARPPFHGVRMNILPTVLRPSGMIHVQMRSLVSGIKGFEKQGGKDIPIMEVAEISSEITLPKDSTCLLFGPVIRKGNLFQGSETAEQPGRLLMLITPQTATDNQIETIPAVSMENLPGLGAVGNGGPVYPDKENAVHDDLIGWYQMQNKTLIPVFKRDGAYYSTSRGFEIPLRPCPEGLIEAHTPAGEQGTTIGRYPENPDACFISIVDRQREHIEEDFISGQKQEIQKIEKPFDLLDPSAPAPKSIDDFLGWYQPAWFPWVRFEIRKENQSYSAAEHFMQNAGQWTPGHTEKLTLLADGLGFAEDGEPVSWIYNEAMKRFEITLKANDTVFRSPLVRISPREKAIPDPVNIGIPYWH